MVGLGIRRRAIWNLAYYRSIPGQVRVLFFLTRNARQLPLPIDPRRGRWKPFNKKTPLQQLTEEKVCELKLMQTSAPASTLSLRPTFLLPACCSRGQA